MLNKSRVDFEGVIFDFDNTLVDTASSIREAYKHVFSAISKDFNADINKLIQESENFQKEKMEELALSKVSYSHADWIAPIAARLSIELGDKEEKYKQLFYSYVTDNPIFSQDTLTLIKELKMGGKKLALLTERDNVSGMKMKRIEKTPFGDYFDIIVIAGETTTLRKTDGNSALFFETARSLGISAKSILMVGDRPDLDIQGSKEAGMKAILFTGYINQGEFSSHKADFVANSVSDLKNIML